MSRRTLAAAAMSAPAFFAASAQAHVTLQPKTAAAGAYTVEDVRVPNERDDATTTKVRLQLPDGFAEVSYQADPGWTVSVQKAKLATPVKTDDGEVTEGVKEITWTAKSKADGIAPGQFRDFPLSVQIPGKPGDSLTFKALQTYSNGEVVRWIGPKDADQPAPQIAVTKDASASGATEPASAAPTRVIEKKDSGNGLSIAALVVGILGLLAGAAALATRRRA